MATKCQVNTFLQERRRAMGDCRFKPENFYEIPRVLGSRYAPDLNRVVSKHRDAAASAYMKRLQRDVDRGQNGFYDQLQALPLQIKRLDVQKEEPRSFKSVLIPKLKLSPLPDTKARPIVSPQESKPACVVQTGSNFVPHKYFSPHSHTHIHVLFKQMPGQTSHKKGSSSLVGSDVSGSTNATEMARRYRSNQQNLKANKLPTPRENNTEEEAPSTTHLPVTLPKFSANHSPLPHIKKRLCADNIRSPRQSNPSSGVWKGKNEEMTSAKGGKEKGCLSPTLATSLAANSSTNTLHKLKLPPELASAYDKNLPSVGTSGPPKAIALSSKGRLPLPSIPTRTTMDNEMLAIVSVQQSNIIHVAA